MRNATRWLRVSPLVLLASLTLAACGGDAGRDGETSEVTAEPVDGEPARGGTVIVSSPADIGSPMPVVWTTQLDSDMVDVLYMGLLRADWRDGALRFLTADESPMALAWHYEFLGPDSTSIRFRMRSGLRWSDGQPITARDVKWTADQIKDPETASPRQTDLVHLDSVQVENDSTVVLHYARRFPDMLFASHFPVAPAHVFQGTDPSRLANHPSVLPGGTLVSSGPFRLTGWRPNAEFTLEANPYSATKPLVDRIVVRVVPDQTTQVGELQAGRVDMVTSVPLDRAQAMRQATPHVRLESMEKRFVEYLGWNPRTFPAFADPEIRRALSLAVDPAELVQQLGIEQFAVPAAGPYPPILRGVYDPQRNPPLRADTARARAILEAKGWRDTDGDGIREKDGRPFRVTLETNTGNQRRADAGQILQQRFRDIGVDLQLRAIEFGTQQERLMNKEFEAVLGSWGVQLSPDISQSFLPGATYNVVSYDDPETTRLLQQALAQPTEERALPLWRAAADRIMQSHPSTWLYYYDQVVGVNERLRNTEIDSFGPWNNPWAWWIPKELQAGPQASLRTR